MTIYTACRFILIYSDLICRNTSQKSVSFLFFYTSHQQTTWKSVHHSKILKLIYQFQFYVTNINIILLSVKYFIIMLKPQHHILHLSSLALDGFRMFVKSRQLWQFVKTNVSLANKLTSTLHIIIAFMVYVHVQNNSGPRTLPCSTPKSLSLSKHNSLGLIC